MKMQFKASLVCGALAFVLLSAASVAYAQTTRSATANSSDAKDNSANPKKQGDEAAIRRFDADLDDDGILDIVQTLSWIRSTDGTGDASKKSFEQTLTAGFDRKVQLANTHSRHNGCTDYLLLSPENRRLADQKVQSRTLGVFGTRPCDPFVSPLLERPYDDEYAEIAVLPWWMIIVRDTSLSSIGHQRTDR